MDRPCFKEPFWLRPEVKKILTRVSKTGGIRQNSKRVNEYLHKGPSNLFVGTPNLWLH